MMDLGNGRDWEGKNRETEKESVPVVNHFKPVDGSIINLFLFTLFYHFDVCKPEAKHVQNVFMRCLWVIVYRLFLV